MAWLTNHQGEGWGKGERAVSPTADRGEGPACAHPHPPPDFQPPCPTGHAAAMNQPGLPWGSSSPNLSHPTPPWEQSFLPVASLNPTDACSTSSKRGSARDLAALRAEQEGPSLETA